jgi:hypothetical protein
MYMIEERTKLLSMVGAPSSLSKDVFLSVQQPEYISKYASIPDTPEWKASEESVRRKIVFNFKLFWN